MESQLSCLSLSSNNFIIDSLSLRKIFFKLRSTNDIISASLVCKHWRQSFEEAHLRQHIEKTKKHKQRLVIICFNIKPEWADEALKNNKNIFELSVAKDRREGIRNWKYKANIKKIAKERPVDYRFGIYPKELQPHKDGNSPIIIIDIEYEGVKQRIHWEKLIIPTNLQTALVGKNKWRGPSFGRPPYCQPGCKCGLVQKSNTPPPGARFATPQEISELKL